jgi:hypothetical protein
MSPKPGLHVRVSERSHGIADLGAPLFALFRKPYRCEVPICAGCRPQLRRHRWWRLFLFVTCGSVAYVLLDPVLRPLHLPRPVTVVIMVAGMIVLGLPFLLLDAKHPPAFEFYLDHEFARFTFRNEEYARCFRQYNPHALKFRIPAGSEPEP